jgi:hypothetical protein
MGSPIIFIVYANRPTQTRHGILGPIDVHCIQLLLAGGKYCIEEVYEGNDPIGWYTNILQEQGIQIKGASQQTWKGRTLVWLEVDPEQTPIHEFTMWNDVPEHDIDTLAWKPVLFPCTPGTHTECLGLAVSTQEINMFPKQPKLNLYTILQTIIKLKQAP